MNTAMPSAIRILKTSACRGRCLRHTAMPYPIWTPPPMTCAQRIRQRPIRWRVGHACELEQAGIDPRALRTSVVNGAAAAEAAAQMEPAT